MLTEEPSNFENTNWHKIFAGLVVVVSIAYYVYANIKSSEDRDLINQGYGLTIGGIVKYNGSGSPTTIYMTYYYFVDGMRYTRKVSNYQLERCEYNFEECKDNKYWVAYSIKDHSKSLINVYNEIQGQTDPKPPENLEWFK